jgi:hypothetical protein
MIVTVRGFGARIANCAVAVDRMRDTCPTMLRFLGQF